MIRGILKKITVCAAILIITLSVLLNLTYFILNTLPNNNRFFSALASRVLQEPVVIKKAKIEGFSIFPVIKLYGIAFGKKIPDASRIHLSELQVTLNLWHSFWQKQWITEKISIDHLKLRVDQDAKNNFHISGLSIQSISIEQDSALWSAITQWISAQPTIIFEHASLDFYSASNAHLPVHDLNLLIKNDDKEHIISAELQLEKKLGTRLQLIANINGDQTKVFLKGNQVQLSQWIPFLYQFFPAEKLKNVQGLSDFKLWANYNGLKWQRFESQFTVTDAVYNDFKINNMTANGVITNEKNGWQISAIFDPISLARSKYFPGFSGLSAQVKMTANQGALKISGKNANILLPIGSSKNISPVTLVTKMRWFQKNGVFKVTTSALKIDNSQWHLFGQFLSEINLQKTPAVSFSGNTILNGLNIKNIQGTLPNFKNPILMLHAQIETDLYKALLLLRQSALPISTHLSEVKGSGPLLCDVQVKLPLAEKNSAISAQGKIHFLGDQLDLLEWNLPLTELTGVATFDQDNFSATGLKTLLFQQLMSVSIGMRPSLHLSVSGIITPGQFASRFNLPILKGVNKKTHVNVQLIFSNLNSEHLSQLNAVMDNLYYVHQSWHHLSLSVKPKSTETVIQLQNPNVSGEITIPDNSKLPLNANFNYLFLQSEKDFDSSKVELINPANIRPLIISIDHFHLDQKAEGHLNLITQPINDGLAIKTIKINSPFLKFSANGSWTQRDGKTKTVLTGEVESPNLGSLLMQRHLSSRLKGGVLSSSFSLAWPNTPQQFLITKSSGKMDIKITNGRILQLDSDTESNLLLGKIFNLLSLESLSHLLTFNFSSFTKSGFLFDVLQGNVKLDNGILSSREIEIDSPVAKIDFSGTINLINQLNNLNMTVFPRVSSSLPVLVAFAGGPVIGAAAWLANKLVSPVVSDIMQMHYHISGTLNKPVLKKLDN